MSHIPVLLQEVIENLQIRPGAIALDATVGGGGYTRALSEAVGESGIVIGLDQDGTTLEEARVKLADVPSHLHLVNENFRNLDRVLETLGIDLVDAIAFDLGLSSLQLEASGRGFSFLRDEPLAMTFSATPEVSAFTAADIVNTWDEEDIANVIFGYGEERYSRRIAKAIVESRVKTPFTTSKQLGDFIAGLVTGGYKGGGIHPATKTFQALRIAVNDELSALEDGLAKAFDALAPDGRMAVVSFHSLEDRIVKNFFRDKAQEGADVSKKPIVPTKLEQKRNPRSRSAKLRILHKAM